MNDGTGMMSMGAKWLLERWLEKLTGVIESMTEENPALTWRTDGEEELGEGALILEQKFSTTSQPMLWLGVPETTCQALGGRVLAVAGLETSDEEENRATCLEIIDQSLAGLTGALNQRISQELTREQTKPCAFFPSGLAIVRVIATIGGKELPPLWIAFAPELISWIDAKPPESTNLPESAATPIVEEPITAVGLPTESRTFDLLLDVALPVSVSFGKAEMPVKDVLKLTTGSIVELNRSISDPVDIIVNGCTIARAKWLWWMETTGFASTVLSAERKDCVRAGPRLPKPELA